MGKLVFPLVPTRLILRFHFDSISKIDRLTVPMLFSHSAQDDLVPYSMGRKLFDKAVTPKAFLELEGSHNELTYLESGFYRAAMKSFLATGNPKLILSNGGS